MEACYDGWMSTPWWFSHVTTLSAPPALHQLSLGELWSLSEGLRFVRRTVDPSEVAIDVAASPEAGHLWSDFVDRERKVANALGVATELEQRSIRAGSKPPAQFREHWERLGFVAHAARDGSPADDYLDALFQTSRLSYESSDEPTAHVNLGSRASRVSDFLDVTRPDAMDVVFDLGSGSGKLALTVAASSTSSVLGVELLHHAVDDARRSASSLGLVNTSFHQADVRDVDLSGGSIFYLYYPFHGPVASSVASALGTLAREKDITIYASGPRYAYGEFFLREVDAGALVLTENRGEFGEVFVMHSRR